MSSGNNVIIVKQISECFIKPQHISEEAIKQPIIHLSPWDLPLLSVHYIQKGLLFPKPPPHDDQSLFSVTTLLHDLKRSLSATLTHFYPLAARLATATRDNPPSSAIYLDLNGSPGAGFKYATADLTVSDILSSSITDVPVAVVQSLFDRGMGSVVNHDGHTLPLLTVKVTELTDGVFVGCSINHVVADGTAFWNFFNAWSEMFRSGSISRPPELKRWVPDSTAGSFDTLIDLPFTYPDQFISRPVTPLLRERIFHFSSASLLELKAKANTECRTTQISTLQALSALVWRCVARARHLPPDRETNCTLLVNNRTRLIPHLSNDYFGNSIETVSSITTAGELLDHELGWAACLLHEAVLKHDDKAVRDWVESWLKRPFIYQLAKFFNSNSLMIGSSPRFEMYEVEFGLGKALAIRSGYGNKFDGKVQLYPGREGDGSMDLEVCLSPDSMSAFESDDELISFVTRETHFGI